MNKGFLLLVLCLVSGCGQKADPRDAKLANLETRVVQIEARYQEVDGSLSNLLWTVKTMNSEYGEGVSNLMALTLEQQANWKGLEKAMLELAAATTNAPHKSAPQSVPVRSNYGAMKDGVPIAVYNAIKGDAVKKWPKEYDMQVYEIQTQVEAYRKLHP